MLSPGSLFDLFEFDHAGLFNTEKYVWEALDELKDYMDNYNYPDLETPLIKSGELVSRTVVYHKAQFIDGENCEIEFGDVTKGGLTVTRDGEQLEGASVIMSGATLIGNQIELGKGVLIEGGAMVKSPTILGDHTEVRQGAYLRGYCLAGKRCVLGHATEVKHSIFLNDAKAGHFAYLGDSILGTNTNLGAGTKFANLRFLSGNVSITCEGERIDTGRRKFGAILGDDSQTGCNSVTNPGTIFGKQCMLMPNTTAPSGFHKRRSIIRG